MLKNVLRQHFTSWYQHIFSDILRSLAQDVPMHKSHRAVLVREAEMSWKPWQLSASLLHSPSPAGEETNTCAGLIPFNTCIQRRPPFWHDMKIHRGLTRYIFWWTAVFLQCLHITRSTHQRWQTALAIGLAPSTQFHWWNIYCGETN
jgi:hypothetical protein